MHPVQASHMNPVNFLYKNGKPTLESSLFNHFVSELTTDYSKPCLPLLPLRSPPHYPILEKPCTVTTYHVTGAPPGSRLSGAYEMCSVVGQGT